MIAGVDGCKGGWIAVLEHEETKTTVEKVPTFSDLVRRDDLELIVVDVPIGLPAAEPRLADRMARKLLGSRAVCVFSAPYRSMLSAMSYEEACDLRRSVDGKSCSRQAFAIISKIREVDDLMAPSMQTKVVEGHPEVSFALANGGQPIPEKKKSREGQKARLSVLLSHFPDLAVRVSERRPTGVGMDDLLDAYVMLWTARRIRDGIAQRLPPSEQVDERGLRAEIVG